MEGYEEFAKDLNRMPTNTRSSLNATSPSDHTSAPRTPTAAAGRQANSAPARDSPYPFSESTLRAQRSIDNALAARRAEQLRQPPSADLDESMSARNYRSDFLGHMRPLPDDTESRQASFNRCVRAYAECVNRRAGEAPLESYNNSGQPVNFNESNRSTGGPAQQSASQIYNESGRSLNQSSVEGPICPLITSEARGRGRQTPTDNFNVSGRPLNISEFAVAPVCPLHRPPDTYNPAGRPLNFSEFIGERSRSQERTPEHHNASGRPFNLSEFATSPIVSPHRVSDRHPASGRPLNLSDFNQSRPGDRAHESFHASGRPLNFSEFAEHTRSQHQSPERINASSRPLNLSGSNQMHSDSLNASNRHANLTDFGGNRTESMQRSAVSQIPTFHSADRSIADRNSQAYSFATKTPLNLFDFGGSASMVTTNSRLSGLGSRHQVLKKGESHDMCSTLSCPFSAASYKSQSRGSGSRAADESFKRLWSQKPNIGGRHPGIPDDDNSPNITDCHKGTNDCPRLPEDKLLSFLQYGDIKPEPPTRHPLFNTLVRDSYYPGAIEDAVNGKIDFNAIAFDNTFGCSPIPDKIEVEDVPITLLQAFEERLNYEDELRECLERRREYCLSEYKKNPTIDEEAVDTHSELAEHTKFWTHRDELKLASTIDIDLATNYRDHPETGLTRALACLFKAEKMNNYDKFVHMAEAAIRKKQRETPEKAALKSSCSFHIDMQKDEGKVNNTYNPIEIISYVGTTKPNDES